MPQFGPEKMRHKMETGQPNKFVITITGDESGIVTAHDSRSGETEQWDGVAIILGSVSEHKFAPYFWGKYESIVYGFYGSIMSARNEQGAIGEHHRNILGKICRMILELYNCLRKAHEFTAEGIAEKFGEGQEKPDDKLFH